MPLVLLDKCCCLSLRTGVLIVGYLHAAVTVLVIGMHIALFAVAAARSGGVSGLHESVVFGLTTVQAATLVYLGTTVALIYGATKGNRYYLIPFVSIHTMVLAYLVLIEVLACLLLVSSIVSFSIVGAESALNVYVIYVVISHHQELKKVSIEIRQEDEISIVNALV